MLVGACVVRSTVHVAGRGLVVYLRRVAVVVSGEGGGGWCNNCFADLLWSLHGGTEQRAQVPSTNKQHKPALAQSRLAWARHVPFETAAGSKRCSL